jgi:hypothetical protein
MDDDRYLVSFSEDVCYRGKHAVSFPARLNLTFSGADHVPESDVASGDRELTRDFGRRFVSISRTCELQPFIRKAKPDRPIPLGPSEAGQLATTIGLQAQLVAHCEAWKDFSIRRHADRGYTPSFRRWSHAIHTRACPRNKLSQGLTEAIEADLRPPACRGSPPLPHGQRKAK